LPEALGGGRRVVGEQPLLARPQVRLGAGHLGALGGRGGKPAHPQRCAAVISGTGGAEFDRVEFLAGQLGHGAKVPLYAGLDAG
jgi:hypothetical protein